MHDVAPVPAANVPAAHGVQDVAVPPLELLPALHETHDEPDTNLPAVHVTAVHTYAFTPDHVPTAQGRQLAACKPTPIVPAENVPAVQDGHGYGSVPADAVPESQGWQKLTEESQAYPGKHVTSTRAPTAAGAPREIALAEGEFAAWERAAVRSARASEAKRALYCAVAAPCKASSSAASAAPRRIARRREGAAAARAGAE